MEIKVIIDKSPGEVSLLEQDTIENVSEPIKNKFFFLTSFHAAFLCGRFNVFDF